MSTNAKQFKIALKVLKEATDPRVLQPILDNVLLGGHLRTTNLDMTAIAHIPTPVRTTVPLKALSKAFESMNDDTEPVFASNESRLHVSGGRATVKLMTLDADEFPDAPAFTTKDSLTYGFNRDEFLKMMTRVIPHAAIHESNNVLGGVHFNTDAERLELCATNGSTMSMYRCDENQASFTGLKRNVPATFLTSVVRAVKLVKPERVSVSFSDTGDRPTCRVRFDIYEFISREIDGQYPMYRQLIPHVNKHLFKFNRAEFLNAIKTVKPFSNDRTHVVKLRMEEAYVTMSASQPDGDECTFRFEHADTIITGDDIMEFFLAFNWQYLETTLKTFQDDTFTVSSNGALSPALFHDSMLHNTVLIMPVQVK